MPPAANTRPSGPPSSICKKRQQYLLTGGLWATGEKTRQAPNTVPGVQIGGKLFFNCQKIKGLFIHSPILLWNEVRN